MQSERAVDDVCLGMLGALRVLCTELLGRCLIRLRLLHLGWCRLGVGAACHAW